MQAGNGIELHRLGIAGLHAAYADGTTTPSAVTAAALARTLALNPGLNAVADLDRDGALAAAAESDRKVREGAARPLEGIPIGVKSNIAVAGLPWTAGMEMRHGIVADRDAAVVARLRAAGAVIVGTLGMHEAALGATSDNPWYGRIENPHRAGYTPGGSSGGSAAAVAEGLCVAALGTDTLGSVRIPAAYCGVFGLKPGHGIVPDDGVVPVDRSLDAVGVLARDAGDLAAVSRVIGAAHPPVTLARLLLLADPGEVEPAVGAALVRAAAGLDLPRSLLALPDALAVIRLAGFVAAGRALLADIPDRAAPGLSPELRHMLGFCAGCAPQPEILDRTRTVLRLALGDDGVLLMPTTPQAAFAHGRAPVTQADFTGLANIAGLPALALPAGTDAAGLPVGVQLVGPPGSEDALLALGGTLAARLAGYAPPPGF